jgi:hypothetical protein
MNKLLDFFRKKRHEKLLQSKALAREAFRLERKRWKEVKRYVV